MQPGTQGALPAPIQLRAIAAPTSADQLSQYVNDPRREARELAYRSNFATEGMLESAVNSERDSALRAVAAHQLIKLRDNNATTTMVTAHNKVVKRIGLIKWVSVAMAGAWEYVLNASIGTYSSVSYELQLITQNPSNPVALVFLWAPIGIVVGGVTVGAVLKHAANKHFKNAQKQRSQASAKNAQTMDLLENNNTGAQQNAPAAQTAQVQIQANTQTANAPNSNMLNMLPPPPPPTVAIY